jgi:hypothetical protein
MNDMTLVTDEQNPEVTDLTFVRFAKERTGGKYDPSEVSLMEELKLRKAYADEIRNLDVRHASPVTLSSMAGEVLYVLRPLVYLWALYRYGGGGKRTTSWTPYLLSLGIDLLSRRLIMPTKGRLNKAEEAEMSRRLLLLAFYLIRSPFFERFIFHQRSPSESEEGAAHVEVKAPSFFDRLPFASTILSTVSDLLTTYKARYFYTAGSS